MAFIAAIYAFTSAFALAAACQKILQPEIAAAFRVFSESEGVSPGFFAETLPFIALTASAGLLLTHSAPAANFSAITVKTFGYAERTLLFTISTACG